MVDHVALSGVLADFARHVVGEYDVEEMLTRLCERSTEVLPASGAGVMIADDSEDLHFVAASDDTVRAIESLQIELGEGPCLHAYESGEHVVVADLEHSDRFPRFAPPALAAGLRGVYSFAMHVSETRVGALNLYRRQAGDFNEADRAAGRVLADVATAYILNTRAFQHSSELASQLQRALDTRVMIEQAKGRLVEQLGIGVGEAFELLRRHARRNSLPLQQVARDVAEGRLRLGPSRGARS